VAGLNVGGSTYQRFGSYWNRAGANGRALVRAQVQQNDSDSAALGQSLFSTLSSSNSEAVNLTARIASARIQAANQAKLSKTLASLDTVGSSLDTTA
jgi:hypothetical protein